MSLLDRSLATVWHPCSQMKRYQQFPLLPIVRGQGVWLYDEVGRAYLDGVSSWWVNLFGHCNSYINQAIREQLEQLEHIMLAGFTHPPVVELSERLIQLAPKGLGHCAFGSDGASAVEMALKMAVHYWRNLGLPDKHQFVSLSGSYHGETIGALGVTDVSLFREAYAGMIRQHATVLSPDSRLAESGESDHDYALRCVAVLEAYLADNHQTLAAFIIEPLVQGAAGMAMYHPVYLQQARILCDRYQVLLIADEIAVGMGRTGTMFACEQANITPDFLCLSKGITGGYLPLSVVMTRDEIYQAFYHDDVQRAFLHSHSYTGNPLACRAALATLSLFEQQPVLVQNRAKADYLNQRAESLIPQVKNWRNTGFIWAFEFENAPPLFAQQFFQRAINESLLLRPMANTVYFMPPYVISETEIDLLLHGVHKVLESFK